MLQKTMVTGWGLKACRAPATRPNPYVRAPGASKYPAPIDEPVDVDFTHVGGNAIVDRSPVHALVFLQSFMKQTFLCWQYLQHTARLESVASRLIHDFCQSPNIC